MIQTNSFIVQKANFFGVQLLFGEAELQRSQNTLASFSGPSMLKNIHQPLEAGQAPSEDVQMKQTCLVCVFPVCVRLLQQKPAEGQPADHAHAGMTPPCGSPQAAALCSDDDWVRSQQEPFLGQHLSSQCPPFSKGWKCPSGCRVQGLILQRDRETNRSLREVCQKVERYEDVLHKSMRLLADTCTEQLPVMADRQSKNGADLWRLLKSVRKSPKVVPCLQSRTWRAFET